MAMSTLILDGAVFLKTIICYHTYHEILILFQGQNCTMTISEVSLSLNIISICKALIQSALSPIKKKIQMTNYMKIKDVFSVPF